MMKVIIKKFGKLSVAMNSLSVYRGLLQKTLFADYLKLAEMLCSPECDYIALLKITSLYSEICKILFESSFDSDLSSFVYNSILYDENKFSRECFISDNVEVNLFNAAQNDYQSLMLLAGISSEEIIDAIQKKFPQFQELMPNFSTYKINLEMKNNPPRFEKVVNFYRKNSFGIFASHTAFVLDEKNNLNSVDIIDNIRLSDLKLYDFQKETLIKNTLAFVQNMPCLNALLYGDRGCGKSSIVKALLNEYSSKNLRLIQIKKDNLNLLVKLFEKLAFYPLKFLLFIDDLTFNEQDKEFGELKAALEGAICKQPKNVIIYATSNRRHLVKETFKSREGDELHLSDTIDETLSLADRFGLVVNYNAPRKDNYLEIVRLLAKDKNLILDEDTLFKGAEAWALEKATRSPRVASQYIDYLLSAEITT